MRAWAISLLLLVTACGDGADAGDAHAAEPLGQYRPVPATAGAATGELSIQRAGLIFENGVVLYTRTLEPRASTERTARDGMSYLALVGGSSELSVELRRVTEAVVAHDAAPICADERPSYAALVIDRRSQHLTLLIFAGDQPPGPEATQTTLCATLRYTSANLAPQGVVLR